MNITKSPNFETQFAADVFHGLTANPKKISSKYFYDARGDELFQQIMNLPEYYLTGKEFEILSENKTEIAKEFASPEGFDLIELGAGDGKKTKLLLQHFEEEQLKFKYFPVDISENVLNQLSASLAEELPGLDVEPQQGTYAQVLEKLADYRDRKKVIMFLGSNVGNLREEEAVQFLKKISSSMGKEDLFFMGVDQKKHPEKILAAYNDSSGVTAGFNKNLLDRINRELNADFDPEAFIHWPIYDPETGEAKSFLVSTKEQVVEIVSLDLEVKFRAWEPIHTEISRKYDDTSIERIAAEAGLKIRSSLSDKQQYFKNYIFKKNIK